MTGKKTLTKTSGKDLVGQTTSPSEETPQQSASDNRSTKRPEMTYGLWADRTTHIEVAGHLGRVLDEMHDPGPGGELPEPEAEVERHAGRHHEVGPPQRQRASS